MKEPEFETQEDEIKALMEEFHQQWEDNPFISREEAERIALEAGREEWRRKQLQRRMTRSVENTLKKYQPGRATKHPVGSTKSTVASRKAKNRKKAKAQRRSR